MDGLMQFSLLDCTEFEGGKLRLLSRDLNVNCRDAPYQDLIRYRNSFSIFLTQCIPFLFLGSLYMVRHKLKPQPS